MEHDEMLCPRLLKGWVHDRFILVSPVPIPVPGTKEVPNRCLVAEWYLLFIEFLRMSDQIWKIVALSHLPNIYLVYLPCVRRCSGCWGYTSKQNIAPILIYFRREDRKWTQTSNMSERDNCCEEKHSHRMRFRGDVGHCFRQACQKVLSRRPLHEF